jgi:ComF family protein
MFEGLKKNISDLFFPVECITCAQPGQFFCGECQKLIVSIDNRCLVCNDRASSVGLCSVCAPSVNYDEIYVLGKFTGTVLETAVEKLKFSFIEELAKILAQCLSAKLSARGLVIDSKNAIIIPIPLHEKRFCERGFNQSELLAQELARDLRGVTRSDILFRSRATRQQARLSRAEREENIHDAFTIRNGEYIKDKIVYIIDDVFTSGATVNFAAKLIREYAPQKIVILALAHG